VSLAVQAVLTVVIFAGIYDAFGLTSAESDSRVRDAIYFSTVTWTTLGYGDLQPPEAMRLVAAFQAVLGYIYLGSLVAIIGSLLVDQDKTDPK
ncbi:MAG: potassium channel family protein, partial [Pseudomonadota bacterium]